MKYGLLDTQDNCWLGKGGEVFDPFLYDDYLLAQLAARIFDVQLGQLPGRTVAVKFVPPELPKKKDEVQIVVSCEEAIRLLEEGLVL